MINVGGGVRGGGGLINVCVCMCVRACVCVCGHMRGGGVRALRAGAGWGLEGAKAHMKSPLQHRRARRPSPPGHQ